LLEILKNINTIFKIMNKKIFSTIPIVFGSLFLLSLSGCSQKLHQVSENVSVVGEENGIRWGTAVMEDYSSLDTINFGSGQISYSLAGEGNSGYLYGNYYQDFARKPVLFANVIDKSPCSSEYVSNFGYKGFNSLRQVKEVEELSFKEVKSIMVGVKNPITNRDACYNGLIVFKQGEFYGVIEPLEMVGQNFTDLKIRWWVGEPGITDFSQAPTKF